MNIGLYSKEKISKRIGTFNNKKVFGHSFFGSAVLAKIFYNMSSLQNNIIKNFGLNGSTNDGIAHSSNHLFLNGINQSVNLPQSYNTDALGNVTLPSNAYVTYYDVNNKKFHQISSTGDVGDNIQKIPMNNVSIPDISFTNNSITVSANGNNFYSYCFSIMPKPLRKYRQFITKQDNIVSNVQSLWFGAGYGGCNKNSFSAHYGSYAIGNMQSGNYFWDFTTTTRVADATLSIRTANGTVTGNHVATNMKVVEILKNSKTFNMDESFSLYFPHNAPMSQADIDALNADPNIIYDVWFNNYVLPSGFSKANIGYEVNGLFTPCFIEANDGDSTKTVILDIATNNSYQIVNFTQSCKTTYKNVIFGATNFKIIRDAFGRATGTKQVNGSLIFTNQGEYIDTQWIPNSYLEYSITETVTLQNGTIETRVFTSANSNINFKAIFTSATAPTFVNDGTVTVTDNLNGTFTAISYDCTYCKLANTLNNILNIKKINLINTDGITGSFSDMFLYSAIAQVSTIPPPPPGVGLPTQTPIGAPAPAPVAAPAVAPEVVFGEVYTGGQTDLSYMMNNWINIVNPPILTSLDTSSVVNMIAMMANWSSVPTIGNIGIENFNISSLVNATDMLLGSKLATITYDQVLINWQAQPHNKNVTVNFGNSNYTLGSQAEVARNALIADGWIITDAGGI
jgi:hypothetical protein